MNDKSGPGEVEIVAWARLLKASAKLLDAVERDLKQAGLPPLAWYDALLELHRARPDGLRPGDLEKEMLLPQYNVSGWSIGWRRRVTRCAGRIRETGAARCCRSPSRERR